MSEPTVFEQIIDGDIPANIVYETDDVAAFFDANPLAAGHTLVVPTEPYERLRDMPPGVSDSVFSAVRTLAPAIEDAVDADSTTVGINDGSAAGQEVPHVHVHIIPRSHGDGGGSIHTVMGPGTASVDGDEIADDISAQLE